MKFAPYSYSKIALFDKCNRAFKYAKIDKAETNEKDMTALLKGRAVHDIIDKFPTKSNHKLADKYQDIANNFIASDLGQKYLFVDSKRELEFGLTKKLDCTSYYDKEALFRGKIDFFSIINDTVYVCDWKTGKYVQEQYQSYEQLIYYAIFIFTKYSKIDKIKISYVYIDYIKENIFLLERKYLENYQKMLLKSILKIEQAKEFPKNKTPLCDWCDYSKYCSSDE